MLQPTKTHCRTCHQHNDLLTNVGFGSDSNTTPIIARLIARHYPDGVLDGIPNIVSSQIKEEHIKDQDDDRGSISAKLFRATFAELLPTNDNDFEFLSKQAINIMNDNKIWHDGCVYPKDKIACRKLMLQKTLFCQLGRGLSNHISCLMNEQLKPKATTESEKLMRDFPNYIDNKYYIDNIDNNPEMRQGFSLSAAGKQVLTKIKATKLGDLNQHLDKDEPGLHHLVSVFLKAGGGGVDFPMPQGIPSLSTTDLAIISDEVERLFIHVQRKDLHLNTDSDPTYERKRIRNYFPVLGNRYFGSYRVTELFRQQTLLPANQQEQDMWITHILPRISIDFDDSANTLQGTLSSFNFAFTPDEGQWHEAAIKPKHEEPQGLTVPCQVVKNTRQCEFKDLPMDTSGCDSCKTATLDITLRVQQNPPTKPPTSLATLKLDGKNYHFALLCADSYYNYKKDEPNKYIYSCALHDAWQIEAAFQQLVADRHSPLYSDYFNPVAIIRHMLKNVGYQEPPHN